MYRLIGWVASTLLLASGCGGDDAAPEPQDPMPDNAGALCEPAQFALEEAAEVAFERIGRGQLYGGVLSLSYTTPIGIPDGCRVARVDPLIESEEALQALIDCSGDASPAPSGFDWSTRRLAMVVVVEHPDASVAWVVEDAAEISIGVIAPDHVGGQPPTDAVTIIALPAAEKAVTTHTCRQQRGRPSDPPPP